MSAGDVVDKAGLSEWFRSYECSFPSPRVGDTTGRSKTFPAGCAGELQKRLALMDPIDKMGAAEIIRQRGCKQFVPDLLREVRDRYGPFECDPPPPPEAGKIYVNGPGPCFKVFANGRVPYIDYHEPLFRALSELAIPEIAPDERWYEAIEEWVSARRQE